MNTKKYYVIIAWTPSPLPPSWLRNMRMAPKSTFDFFISQIFGPWSAVLLVDTRNVITTVQWVMINLFRLFLPFNHAAPHPAWVEVSQS